MTLRFTCGHPLSDEDIESIKEANIKRYEEMHRVIEEALLRADQMEENMEISKFISKEEIERLSDKAMKRTKRMGAICEKETIALLEQEIDSYRKKIDFLERKLEHTEEQHVQAEALEAISIPGLTINADTAYVTVYPAGFLEKE